MSESQELNTCIDATMLTLSNLADAAKLAIDALDKRGELTPAEFYRVHDTYSTFFFAHQRLDQLKRSCDR